MFKTKTITVDLLFLHAAKQYVPDGLRALFFYLLFILYESCAKGLEPYLGYTYGI